MRQRPLILLTAAVLAAHVALLAGPGMQEIWRTARITGSSPQELRFETRQIAPEPSAPPAPEAPRTNAIIESVPVKRVGTPDDVAHAVSYLLDARSGFVTGQVLYVCGGMTVGVAGV